MFKPKTHIKEVQAAATGTIGAPAVDLYHTDTWNGGGGFNPNYLPLCPSKAMHTGPLRKNLKY